MTSPHQTLSKQFIFFAAHHYWSEQLSEAENHRIFKACANRDGHGHNYMVDVSISGPIDPKTGMIINFYDLLPLVDTQVIGKLDHQNLNTQVPFFKNNIPTLENITLFIVEALTASLAAYQLSLDTLRVTKHPGLFVEWLNPDRYLKKDAA